MISLQVCNGIKECEDGSDEQCVPKCADSDFACVNGTSVYGNSICISDEYRCDRETDCTDGSDELDCDYSCDSDQFMCETGTLGSYPYTGYCISLRDRCDQVNDCKDGSDIRVVP